MVDFILVVLKYAATLLSGFFGVYGLLLDFKDKDGKITKAGRFALYVIIISGVIALVTQSIELYLDNQKSISDGQRILAQLDQNTKVLTGLDRTLNPIEDLTISYDVVIPSSHTYLKSYTSNLFKHLHKFLDTVKHNASLQNRLSGYGILASRITDLDVNKPSIREVVLSAQCWLLPQRNEFTHIILAYSNVDLVFFRNPLPIDSLKKISFSSYSTGDLAMSVSSGLNSQGLSGEHRIAVDLHKNTIILNARNLKSDPKYWLNNGKVVSIPDLSGCQLVLHLPGMGSGNEETDRYLRDVRKDFELDYLEITMSKGRRYWIDRGQLTKIESKDGMPTYAFQFPTSAVELERMDILR